MMSVVLNDKMKVSGPTAARFRNMAVWEGGYNISLDICRAVDQNENRNDEILRQLKAAATQIPLSLSKGASYKPGKQYLRHLRNTFVSTKQLETLLLLAHDLNHINTERFLDLNSKLNEFSSKLWKYIKYTERKARKRTKR